MFPNVLLRDSDVELFEDNPLESASYLFRWLLLAHMEDEYDACCLQQNRAQVREAGYGSS